MGPVLLIIGVFQLILLVKIWGMCNDVAALRKKFAPELELPERKPYEFKVGMKVVVNSLNTEGVIISKDSKMIKVKLSNDKTTETYPSDLTPID